MKGSEWRYHKRNLSCKGCEGKSSGTMTVPKKEAGVLLGLDREMMLFENLMTVSVMMLCVLCVIFLPKIVMSC